MANDPTNGNANWVIDTLRAYAPGVTPAAIIGGIVSWFHWSRNRKDAVEKEAKDRIDREDNARAERVLAESKVDAAERARLDVKNEGLIKRLEEEISRKDIEIAWWKKDSLEGWTGLNNALLRWTQDNHASDNNETVLLGIIERAKPTLPLPKLRERKPVPDAQVLAGRVKEEKQR